MTEGNRENYKLWDEFIKKWPLERVKSMTLSEYTSAGSQDTFTYWLESKLNKMGGIAGGSAFKFGIFSRSDTTDKEPDESRLYNTEYGWLKKYGESPEEAFENVKHNVIEIIIAVKEGDLEKINVIDLGPAYKWKVAFHYQDREIPTIVPVFRQDVLLAILKSDKKMEMSEIYSALISHRSNDKDILNYGEEIWKKYTEMLNITVWKVSHGRGDFTSEEREKYRKRQHVTVARSTKKGQGNSFYQEMQIGDYFYLCHGNDEGIVLLGQITSEARIGEKGNDWLERSYNPIKELDTPQKYTGINKGWTPNNNSTVKKVNHAELYLFEKEILKKYFNMELSDLNGTHEAVEFNSLPIVEQTTMFKDVGLNIIFYGPPGTGKTYKTVLRAAEIVTGRSIKNYAEALEIFNANLNNQIEFITFHQNYSYEDFIQGLRPDTENNNELSFKKVDGVFKKISDRALENLNKARKAKNEPDKWIHEEKFEIALSKFIEEVESYDNHNYPITKSSYISNIEEYAFRYNGSNWNSYKNGLLMKFSDLKEFYINGVQERKDIKHLTKATASAKSDATYYFEVYKKILKHLPKDASKIENVRESSYVLIIDEINRANISRVFGELITLIEPDKRSHGAIPLKAVLPSGDEFIVPSNLYIIGTMNTADKSIALLDIALRRRFEFEAMYPLYDIDGETIHDVDILKKLNEQIIKTKGHDFQIGHSYFMCKTGVWNLAQQMNKKIIPLLMEYYMNDTDEVKEILISAGLDVNLDSWPLKINENN